MILLNCAGLPLPACHFAVVLDEEVLDESCGSDVEVELVPELDDIPGTTRSTKVRHFRFALVFLTIFGQPWFLTAGPLTRISVK